MTIDHRNFIARETVTAATRGVTTRGRRFLIIATMLAFAVSQPSDSFAQSLPPPAVDATRQSRVLGEGWRFHLGDVEGAQDPEFADAEWSEVSVPHTWNRIGYYLKPTGAASNTQDSINRHQGIGWYRLTFEMPALAQGQAVWLQFDAASRVADVWLNGVHLGSHAGGFSRFRFDATAALARGRNQLAVRVDNSAPTPGSRTADTLPLAGDFFVRGGLYRPVSLIVTAGVHVDMLDYGGPGVYARTQRVVDGNADLSVHTLLRNDTERTARGELSVRLIDAHGRTVAEARSRFTLRPRTSNEIAQSLRVASAHLWQGVADPYLYRLVAEVRASNGRVLDQVTQAFGIREMRLDPERGFFLNGQNVLLHGVGLHQDNEASDWAMSETEIAQRVETIRDMGANSIRLAHYQHGQPIHDLADRHGLVLWDEIPLVSSWTHGNELAPSDGLVANARLQLVELIRQNFNHASVVVWGVANEVDFGSGRPDFLGRPPARVADPTDLLRKLNELAKREDPTRPSVLAICCEGRGGSDVPIVAPITDAAAANLYYGWYYGAPEGLTANLDLLRAARPEQPLALSEYGAGSALSIHTDNPLGGPVDIGGVAQPEEYASWFHERNWDAIRRRHDLWGAWLWNAFDFGTTVRREGDSIDINTKGLVTYNGAIRKDAYYYYKANWSSAPTVHVSGRRYIDRAYQVADVRVYSNAHATEAFMNGRSLGVQRDCALSVCVWPAVRLAVGENQLSATGEFEGSKVSDAIVWRLPVSARNTFKIDSGALVAAASEAGRFGSDAFFEGGRAGTVDRMQRGRPPERLSIAGSPDRDILATYREGDFRYRIPLDNGPYRITLGFVATGAGEPARTFDVLANGAPVLEAYSLGSVSDRGAAAVHQTFAVQVNGGSLELEFRSRVGAAVVSAIEVAPVGQ